MACLEKMRICGIRSFGPDEGDAQEIRFHKPMTLILGENGCGKSTIIECLRYLTAQKEPAGKGTFVHDPNLTLKSTVKAFVKLRIRDSKGNRVDLCRNLQATRTKKSVTTKSLDNVITRTDKNTNEKNSISNRCADFTYEISRIFGVSRAILENVIFCTQEDSHWPLDTDQKLKEKFDQIFDSDSYNKCVSKVREKMKKLKESCKLSEVELKHLEGSKKMAAEKRRDIEKVKKQIQDCEKEVTELNSSLEGIESNLKEVNQKEMELSKNHAMKETKKSELKQVENYITELKSRIRNEFEGTDEELRNALSNFLKQLGTRQQEISKLEESVNDYTRQEAKLSRDLMIEQGKLGQLEKEDEINKERLSERQKCLNSLAIQLDMDSSELSEGSDDSIDYLLSRVQTEMKGKEEELDNLREKYKKEESDCQGEIDSLREKSMRVQNEVTNKERSIKEREMEMSKIDKELNEIDRSVSKLSRIESELSKANKAIEEIRKRVDSEKLKDEMQEKVNERNNIEDRLSEVEDVVRKLQQDASIAAELEVQKELMMNKDADIRRLLNKHEDNLKSLLGEVPASGFRAAVQNQIDKLRKTVKELTSIRTLKEREMTGLEIKRKHQREQIRLKEEKLRSFEEEIYEECGSEDFEEAISSLQSQIDELQDLKGTLSSSEFMYQRYIQTLKKPKPCCPLCHRDFARESEAEILADELTSKVEEVPRKLQENKTDLERKQKRFNKLLTLRGKHEQIVTMKTVTLPAMRAELESTDTALKKIRKELEDVGDQILPPQSDEAICSSMQGDMALLDQLQSEKKKIGWEIDKLEARLGGAAKDGSNLEEMFKEQESLRKRLKTTRKELENLQGMLNSHNEELQLQQANKNSLMEEMNKIQGSAGGKKQLEERHRELQSLEKVQMKELESLKEKLKEATQSLHDAESKKNIQKEKNATELERLSKQVNGYQKQFHDIQAMNNQIKAFEERGIKRKIELAQKQIKKLESDLSEMKTGKEKAMKTISETKRDVANQESRERELQDNVKYRERLQYREELRKEVAVLEKKYGNINFDEIIREKRKLKDQEEAIGRKKALIQGRMGELDVRIEQLQRDLSAKMLKNVEAEYQKELVKLVVERSCAKDLERYATTMEFAMMTYHKQQMERVNSFIREYWTKIYQGNDIEYIEIQAETIASTDRKRNYNYKVVQKKNDAYLEMRNRCSAGQKMLASLIIRMALAETFSCNCGILTLDEPTTNLDRKNIRNLAQMLNEISQTKMGMPHTNFQLIVITHDEDFLRELIEINAVSEFVLVQRNQSGKTVVSREIFNGSLPRVGSFSRGTVRDMDQFLYE